MSPAAFEGAPVGELVDGLSEAIECSNGLDFVDAAAIAKLARQLQEALTERAKRAT